MLEWFLSQTTPKRLGLVALAVVVVWFLLSWISSVVYERDCRHFNTHAGAQRFYHLTGGPVLDFHGLDGDDDGRACERLP